ncbi:hypothetical protein [Chryseobacterium indologenes]|jgi:hypothetical protein|uniref:Uncharacterized protein n=1 Tax=Epilithonimonas zeae TaxID=1416779 RepID=A0A1N6FVA1_9FLAO|nr:hypothetical protein [Chryseobacterium indologenes]MDM1556168.1 hypothetical protein [Chryseobacterium indologenes]GEJ47667.1 hypothetical protein CRS_42750 [Chryseobacterium sp. ON_d1]SIN99266.1 hypothetical protein SAMN05444409_1502 [Epilithonimonas zeae]
MRSKRKQKDSQLRDLKEFELEPLMKFNEMSVSEADKILKRSNINMSEKEISDVLALLHTLVKMTLKELISAKN